MDHHFPEMPPAPNLLAAWRTALQNQQQGILQSSQLTRQQRETLLRAGRLRAIMRGWYQLQPHSPTEAPKPDLAAFLPLYLENRLGSRWCLSAASSLAIHGNDGALPSRLVVISPSAGTTVHTFADGTRLTIYQEENHFPARQETIAGLRVMTPEAILTRLTASQWKNSLEQVDQLLPRIPDWQSFVWRCLQEGRHQALYRLLERFVTLGKQEEARIVTTGLQAAGLAVPKTTRVPSAARRKPESAPNPEPPTASSLEDCWRFWSAHIPAGRFRPDNLPGNLLHRLAAIENGLPEDAQNHLRLAGYDIPTTAAQTIFLERERAAEIAGWPQWEEISRRLQRSAGPPLPGEVDPAALLALQGYAAALKLVKRSVVRMLEGRRLETVLRQDMRGWRLALMGPTVEAGLLPRGQILRYKAPETRRLMDTWIRLVTDEKDPARRGILAFLGLSRLAPWTAGNRRMALLALNALNTHAGLPWVVIRHTEDFQQAWRAALSPASPEKLLDILATSTLV